MEKSKVCLFSLVIILVSLLIVFAVMLSNIVSDSGTLTCTITEKDIGFREDRHYMLCEIKNQTVDASNITIISTGRDRLVNDFNIWRQTDMFFLPDRIGERFPNLIVVGSGYTKIRSLQRSNFIGFRRLRSLYVTNSELEVIEHDAFQPLGALEILDLSNNKITNINPTWFENKKLLVWLSFNDNEIEIIPQGCFDELESLETVWLNSNKISSIPSPLFINNNLIRELRLMWNPLEFVSDTAFDGTFNQLTVHLHESGCFGRFKVLTIPPDDWRSIVRERCNGTNISSLV